MANFDEATPVGSNPVSVVDDNIREFKTAMKDSLRGGAAEGTESIFPGSAPTTAPVFRYRGLKGSTAARPTSGQYGIYFDTSRNSLQRDNGTTWEDIATNFPAGTVMIFAQASAPTGWTKLTTQNDKALRVVSGSTGGAAGGTYPISGGVTHAHDFDPHTHAISAAAIQHKHDSPTVYDTSSGDVYGTAQIPFGQSSTSATTYDIVTGNSLVGPQANKVFQLTGNMQSYAAGSTDATDLTSASSSPVIAYVDVIQCSKD